MMNNRCIIIIILISVLICITLSGCNSSEETGVQKVGNVQSDVLGKGEERVIPAGDTDDALISIHSMFLLTNALLIAIVVLLLFILALLIYVVFLMKHNKNANKSMVKQDNANKKTYQNIKPWSWEDK